MRFAEQSAVFGSCLGRMIKDFLSSRLLHGVQSSLGASQEA